VVCVSQVHFERIRAGLIAEFKPDELDQNRKPAKDNSIYTYDLIDNEAKIGYLALEGKPDDFSAVVRELREGSRSPRSVAIAEQLDMAATISDDADGASGGDASHEVTAAETKKSEGMKKSAIKAPGLACYGSPRLSCDDRRHGEKSFGS
jgi:hypothetical protein